MSENKETKDLEVVKKEVKEVVEANERGELMPRTFEAQYRLASCYTKSKMLPRQFDEPEKTLVALQMCYELGVKPITGMSKIMVLNGTPSLFGDLPLAIVRTSGKLKSHTEIFFDKEGEELSIKNQKPVFGCLVRVERVNGDIVEEMFNLDEAKQAGLTSNVWQKYPKDMLRYRARSRALKTLFPDVLNGVAIAEYDYGIKPDVMTPEELVSAENIIQAQNRPQKTSVEDIKKRCSDAKDSTLFKEEN